MRLYAFQVLQLDVLYHKNNHKYSKKNPEQVSIRKDLCQRGLIVTLMVGAVFNAVNKKKWRSEQHYFAGTLSQTLLAKYRFMTLPRISGVWNMISL